MNPPPRASRDPARAWVRVAPSTPSLPRISLAFPQMIDDDQNVNNADAKFAGIKNSGQLQEEDASFTPPEAPATKANEANRALVRATAAQRGSVVAKGASPATAARSGAAVAPITAASRAQPIKNDDAPVGGIREMVVFTAKRVHNAPEFLSNVIAKYVPHSHHLCTLIKLVDLDIPFLLFFSLLCVLTCLPQPTLVPGFLKDFRIFSEQTKYDYFLFYPWSFWRTGDFRGYLRIFLQNLNHGDAGHLTRNLTNLFLVGPCCEHEFGSWNLMKLFFWISLMQSAFHLAFGHPDAGQLGCSGLVFGLIVLNSLIYLKAHRLPLTFVVQFLLWCPTPASAGVVHIAERGWLNVYSWLAGGTAAQHDDYWDDSNLTQTSHTAHLAGCLVGALMGYHFHHEKLHHTVKHIAVTWRERARKHREGQ